MANFKCISTQNCGPYSLLRTWDERNLVAANSAIFLVIYYLIQLGNFLGISKSVLYPAQDVLYLGFLLDSTQQVFLGVSDIGLFNCVSQNPPTTCGQVYFIFSCHSRCSPVTREMSLAISKGMYTYYLIKINRNLHGEIAHWLFLETWDDPLLWRDECHILMNSLILNTSGSGRRALVFLHETVSTLDD